MLKCTRSVATDSCCVLNLVAILAGQLPEYLPRERGFDAFLGLPFSVDDGDGFISTCSSTNENLGMNYIRENELLCLSPLSVACKLVKFTIHNCIYCDF